MNYFHFCNRIYCWHKVSIETHVSLAFLHWKVPGYTLKYFFLHRRQRRHTHQTTQEVSVWMSETYFSMSTHCWQCHNSTCTSRSSYKILFIHQSQEKKWQLRWCAQIFGCRGLLDLVTGAHFVCARGETLTSCSTQEISAHTIHLWPFFSSSTDTKCENQVSVVKAPLSHHLGEKKKKKT